MRDLVKTMLLLIALGLSPAGARDQSPGESGGSSPPPLTQEQRIDLARQKFDSASALVSQSGRRVAEAMRALNLAQARYDEASELARRELVKHPTLVAAGREVIEARATVREQGEIALRPLRATEGYQRTSRELSRTSIRLDELRRDRRDADRKRLPFPKEDILEIYKLAQQLLLLEDEIATAEAQALDEHKGYGDAVRTLEKAMKESAETMKDVVRLVRGGRELKDALAELQRCYGELAAANSAIRHAQANKANAASSLGKALTSD